MELRRRLDAQRDAYLDAQLNPDEVLLARGPQGIVTEARFLFAWRLRWPPPEEGWTHDALAFEEVNRWSIGRRHDHRPLIRLEHPPHVRMEWVPAHHVLWFRWGNASGGVTHADTTLSFRSDRDRLFVAIRGRLEATGSQQGEAFVIALPGTRAERTRGSVGELHAVSGRFGWPARLRGRVSGLEDRLYRGHVAWRVRLPSWLILAVPAWFIEPWLVLPAIVVAEAAWIIGLQWARHRDRSRRTAER